MALFLSLGVVTGGLLTLVLAWLPIPHHDGFWCFRWLDNVTGDGWFNAARTAVTILGALGIGGAAYIAFRRQAAKEVERYDALDRDQQVIERALHDRTTTAAEQLGHDNASIRIAGVYALAAIADDWLRIERPDQAQAVVEVLTAYLRSDTLPAEAEAGALERFIAGAERARQRENGVRAAIIGAIGDRRQSPEGWTRLTLNLVGAYLNGAHLNGTNLTEQDLAGADLAGADLTFADLTDADLTDADLTNVDLTGAKLNGTNLSGADLTGANLTGADLTGAFLIDATLIDATLPRAQLIGTYLDSAKLIGANLARANLARAYLARADLTGADLTRANLAGALGARRIQFTTEQLESMKVQAPFDDSDTQADDGETQEMADVADPEAKEIGA
ncbi:pentapeptide repeat-containing protein [Gordonia sp. FQ]|uniref:pentapeptide repeat-containing protein n=1 Tax=Gordonia sp. FQ TaxID=3446634 RepID=UPI003F86E3AF